jgi:OOP family OmpA-OmpF porin
LKGAAIPDPRTGDGVSEVAAKSVGESLPKAPTAAADNSQNVAAEIDRLVRNNPQQVVDAIYPVIGPAIRKAISVAWTDVVQSLNQSLTYNFSFQGLKWRLESLQTGKSFAEVVLLHTLLYRVEQVFLIHKETGLLLQHSTLDAVAQDADMVSGMLTAIQDFVQDSFSTGQGDRLETLQVGELMVWSEEGRLAVLSGVIRGNPPRSLRNVFQETLERIHFQFSRELSAFDGDATSLDATRPLLEGCLKHEYQPQSANIAPLRFVIILTL